MSYSGKYFAPKFANKL